MYLEKRKVNNSVKYYLVYSYRDNDSVKKIRKYLGANLSDIELNKKSVEMEDIILNEIRKSNLNVFSFDLTKKQIEKLNKLNSKIKVLHLTKKQWEIFTQYFVYNTNAIEGSTVQEDEVPKILDKKIAINSDEIETKGVAKAIEYIKKTKEDLSLNLILKLHLLCFKGSKPFAGKFRENINVVVKNSSGEIIHTGIHYKDLMNSLNEFIDWYNKNKKNFKPIVLAAIVHNQFEHIHPFQDGNGRIGRLLLNFILLKNNYPPINILLKDRQKYYQTLQEYSKNDNLKPTLDFLIEQYKKTLMQVSTFDE
ncbi:MAG: Fic family protein [Atribacterota bacterium]|jgi:Fic family protein|nr:Fic family protein [Atribacterota bacterium]